MIRDWVLCGFLFLIVAAMLTIIAIEIVHGVQCQKAGFEQAEYLDYIRCYCVREVDGRIETKWLREILEEGR